MTGHAWPLTQGDSKTRCRKSKVHERHDTHSIRQSGPVRKRAANRRLVPKVTGGQLRLSLTNTYHEWPVIRSTLLHRFLDGARTASPVARHVLATVLSLPPRRSDMPPRSVCTHVMLPSPDHRGLGLRFIFCRGHFWVHSRYGPVTRSPSQGWLCQLASSDSFPPRMQPKLRGL